MAGAVVRVADRAPWVRSLDLAGRLRLSARGGGGGVSGILWFIGRIIVFLRIIVFAELHGES